MNPFFRGFRVTRLLRRPSQIRRLRREHLPAGNAGQRRPAAQEGDRPVQDDAGDVGGEDQDLVRASQR